MAEQTAKLISDAGMGLDPAERRLLAAMPLHAITSVHGEAGLRERLLLEIARFPAADHGRAADALALASRLHAADRRQREAYANHLLRVTIRILSHYRVADAWPAPRWITGTACTSPPTSWHWPWSARRTTSAALACGLACECAASRREPVSPWPGSCQTGPWNRWGASCSAMPA